MLLPYERRLAIGFPLHLPVHAHSDQAIAPLVDGALGVEVAVVENRRLRMCADVLVLE